MSIKLKIKGFEDLINNIEAAGGSSVQACENALKGSAVIMQNELKAEMRMSNVPSDLVNEMPNFSVETNGNRTTARVGYQKGNYDPNNLSTGYKVLFLNYGTPHRKYHGQIREGSPLKSGGTIHLGFIQRAKKNANPKIRKQQKQAFEKILERLKK